MGPGSKRWLFWFACAVIVIGGFHLGLALDAYQERSFRQSGSSSYGDLAESLVNRQMLSYDGQTPIASRPPLYPLFLAVLFWFSGGWQAAAIVQSLLAGLSLGFLAIILIRYVDKGWPVLGMLLLALYLSDIAQENIKQRETLLFSFLLISSCLAFVSLEDRYHWSKVILLGSLLGLTCLVRPLGAVGLFFGGMWAWRLKSTGLPLTRIGLRLALFLGIFYLALLPWGLRNWLALNHFTLTSTTVGINLWKGNNPATASFYPSIDVDVLDDLLAEPPAEAGWWDDLRIVPTLSEVERDIYLRRVALAYIFERPDIFFQLGLVKLYSLWAPHYIPLGSGDLIWTSNGAEIENYNPHQRPLAPYLLLYILAFIGAISLRRSALVWFLISWVLFLSLLHFVTFGETRFRWPINLLSLPLAGAGLYWLLNPVIERHSHHWRWIIESILRSKWVPKPAGPHLPFVAWLAGVLVLSLLARLLFLHNFPWGYDEGIHVLLARLLAAGYRPYSELFVSYPPLFVWSLEWPWRIWGSIEAMQLAMTAYALVGVAAVGLIGYRLGRILAGILAAVFLSFCVIYLEGSRAVMTEVPSVGLAVLAVALALVYTGGGRRAWLFASGLAMSASLMLKILSPYVPALIGLLLLVYWLNPERRTGSNWLKALLVDGCIWGLGLVLPILVTLLFYDVKAMYRQVIVFRMASRAEYQEDWAENILILLSFVRSNPALVAAAAWGAGLTLFRQWRPAWFALVWLGLAILFSLVQVPLREKHLPLILPPLAILAGLGLSVGLTQLNLTLHRFKQTSWPGKGAALAAAVLVCLYLWRLGLDYSAISQTVNAPLDDDKHRLVEYLQRFTSPQDCIVTDDHTLAFFAERLAPPNLSEVSSARLRTGYLTYDELVAATQEYGCQVIAPVAVRLKRTRPDFVEWAKQNFVGLWLYEGDTEVLLGQPLAAPRPGQFLHITLDEQVELVGFDLVEPIEAVPPALYVSLYWQLQQPLAEDYTIFVHLRDQANNTIINGDHQPYQNLAPTSRWPVGRTIKETIRLDLPPDLPDGQYRIMVGMYSPATLERLPVRPDSSGENAVELQYVGLP